MTNDELHALLTDILQRLAEMEQTIKAHVMVPLPAPEEPEDSGRTPRH